jgi:hypothetical protein
VSFVRRVDKPDANTASIVEALRKAGAKVWYMSKPADLLVYARGRFLVIEVKNPTTNKSKRQQITADQKALMALGAEDFAIVKSVAEALAFVFPPPRAA